MNLRQAKYLDTICKCGSISNAAKKLYISQPALSQTIQLVEKEIGTKIFIRSTTPISLTYAGEKYMEAVGQMINLEINLDRQLKEIKSEEGGRLRIGISSLRAIAFLPRILPNFIKQYPLVDIEIVETGSTDMSEMLVENKVDIAFLTSFNKKYNSIHYTTLFHEKLILYAGKKTDIVKRIPPFSVINITDVKNETFISLKKGHASRTMQDFIFNDNNIFPKILLETENVILAKDLALSCNFVTLYPESLMTSISNNTNNVDYYYKIAGEQYVQEFFLCHNKQSYITKYMKEFIRIAQNVKYLN